MKLSSNAILRELGSTLQRFNRVDESMNANDWYNKCGGIESSPLTSFLFLHLTTCLINCRCNQMCSRQTTFASDGLISSPVFTDPEDPRRFDSVADWSISERVSDPRWAFIEELRLLVGPAGGCANEFSRRTPVKPCHGGSLKAHCMTPAPAD